MTREIEEQDLINLTNYFGNEIKNLVIDDIDPGVILGAMLNNVVVLLIPEILFSDDPVDKRIKDLLKIVERGFVED